MKARVEPELLATFRAMYGGVQHEDLRLPAYGGHLFDPDCYLLLEGRVVGTSWDTTPARPVPIDNRTVLHLLEALQILRIAVPGTLTTAFLALRLLLPDGFAHDVVPFDQIIGAVSAGKYDAGLIIHEGQLTFQNQGLNLIVDLGVWWQEKTGLPLRLRTAGDESEAWRMAKEAVDSGQMTRIEAIIDSMTPEERRSPKLLNGSRKLRIARGSGTSVQEINQLLKQHRTMQKMMKGMKKGWLQRAFGQ